MQARAILNFALAAAALVLAGWLVTDKGFAAGDYPAVALWLAGAAFLTWSGIRRLRRHAG